MRVVVVGALNGALAVGLGAFGAHVLGGRLEAADPENFQLAVWYQALHAVVMVAVGALKGHVLPALLGAASWAFGLGILLFSGSLYAMALGASESIAILTPIGGGALLTGWLLLAIAAARRI